MLGDCRMPPIARSSHMNSNPLAAEEDLNRTRGEAGLNLAAGEAMRDRVMVAINGDMVVEPYTAPLPLRMDPGLGRKRPRFGASNSSNNWRRVFPNWRSTRISLRSARHSAIAAFNSARL